MALREVRLDLNTPLKIVDAFMGYGLHSKFVKGNVVAVFVDSVSTPFKVTAVNKPVVTATKGAKYVESASVRMTVEADGLYGEKLQLELLYKTYKDNVYKQERPELETLEIRCVNWDTLKFKPFDLFLMCTAEFSRI